MKTRPLNDVYFQMNGTCMGVPVDCKRDCPIRLYSGYVIPVGIPSL